MNTADTLLAWVDDAPSSCRELGRVIVLTAALAAVLWLLIAFLGTFGFGAEGTARASVGRLNSLLVLGLMLGAAYGLFVVQITLVILLGWRLPKAVFGCITNFWEWLSATPKAKDFDTRAKHVTERVMTVVIFAPLGLLALLAVLLD